MDSPIEPEEDYEALVRYFESLSTHQLRRSRLWLVPRFLYKFRTFDPRDSTSVYRLKDLIVRSRFWLSSPLDFNDPFDMSAKVEVDGSIREKRLRLEEMLKDRG